MPGPLGVFEDKITGGGVQCLWLSPVCATGPLCTFFFALMMLGANHAMRPARNKKVLEDLRNQTTGVGRQ